MKELSKDDLDDYLKKQKEYWDNLTSEEKKSIKKDSEETKNLLKHCEIKTEYGYNHDSYKVNIEKFLFLQNPDLNKPINKTLIKTLAFLSGKNIILRYLLIEAGLKDKRIYDVLNVTEVDYQKTFYHISNNPQKFYAEYKLKGNNDVELNASEIAFYLQRYGLFKPVEISKRIILNKINTTLQSKIETFINKFSKYLNKEIILLIEKSKSETLTLDIFLKGINYSFKYFFNESVENQFNLKNYRSSQGFILYLNEMYWLIEENLNKVLDAYFYLPNLSLNFIIGEKDTFHIFSSFHNREIKIKELSANNKYYELFIYAYFRYYLNRKGSNISSDKYDHYYGIIRDEKLKKKRYNQIHALVDSNNDLKNFLLQPNDIPYDFFAGNHYQQFRSWIKYHKENPIFKEFTNQFSLF